MKNTYWGSYGNYYTIIIDLLLVAGIYFFLKLPKEKKSNSFYWIPLVILSFSVFYEALGAYVNYNFELKKDINVFLGNSEHPNYNIWIYNISNKQISTILYLFLARFWVAPSKKKYVGWMILIFTSISLALQITGVEPIYFNQPIIAGMAATMILISCGLYFIDLITNKNFLATNPLRLLSFWQMSFLLFTYSLTYINSIARMYIYQISPQLALSMGHIDRILGISLRSIFLLIIISPLIPKAFDAEPFMQSRKKISSST